jgi:U4/U6 small nuclear ribonucleoprotein PRP3
LTDGRHRFKVNKTAQYNNLSGVTIFHPNFALVVVEGEHRGIEHFKGLMTRRINWTEESRPRGTEGDDEDVADFLQTPAADAPKQSLADNKCEIVWEGELAERAFSGFRPRYVESDTQAKTALTAKWEGMFDLAKKWVWEDEGF